MQIIIPQPKPLFSQAAKSKSQPKKKTSLAHILQNKVQVQIPKRKSIKIQPFEKMLPRTNPQFKGEGVDRIYQIKNDRLFKGYVDLKKIKSRRDQKSDPQFRVYIDPMKKYDYQRSGGIGMIEMKRQIKRDNKFLQGNSCFIQSPQRKQQSIQKQIKLPNIAFNKQVQRNYYYKQKDVRDCYYNPNYQYTRKGLGKVGMPFQKQIMRKQIRQRANSQIQRERFDYETNKHLIYPKRQMLIDFKKMRGRTIKNQSINYSTS